MSNFRLPPLPSIRDILAIHNLWAQKKLSQNFLIQPRSIEAIIKSAGDLKGAHVLEVGPGPGSLTRYILKQRPAHLAVVELDRRFLTILENLKEDVEPFHIKMSIYRQDIMKFNTDALFPELSPLHQSLASSTYQLHPDQKWPIKTDTPATAMNANQNDVNNNIPSSSITSPETSSLISHRHNGSPVTPHLSPRISSAHVIGNIPFNLSTALLSHWLHQMAERRGLWALGRVPVTLCFQKEVGNRIIASPFSVENRSRLSVITQLVCEASMTREIPRSAFIPQPQVDCAVMHIVPRPRPLFSAPFPYAYKLIRAAFSLRQKHVYKGIQTLFPPDRPDLTLKLFSNSDVPPNKKSLELTNAEFARLIDEYERIVSVEKSEIFDFNYQARRNPIKWQKLKDSQRKVLGGITLSSEFIKDEMYSRQQT